MMKSLRMRQLIEAAAAHGFGVADYGQSDDLLMKVIFVPILVQIDYYMLFLPKGKVRLQTSCSQRPP